jgi:hypothetical protein
MTDFLYTDARWTERFVEVNDPHKEGHHVRFYFERPWVGLTDEEKKNIFLKWYGKHWAYTSQLQSVMDSVEAKLKEKNT